MRHLKINKYILILLLAWWGIGIASLALAQTTGCRTRYADTAGQCVATLPCPSNQVQDTDTNLCKNASGAPICCHEVASTSGAISSLELQVPLFNYSQATDILEYIKTIYQYAMIILVPLAIIVIIISGAEWIAAAGNSQKIDSARKRITSAFIGLGLALGSYLIFSLVGLSTLTFHNPQYIQAIDNMDLIDIEGIPPPETNAPTTTQPGQNPADCPKDSELQKIDTSKVPVTGKSADGRLRPNTLAKLYEAQTVAKSQGCTLTVSQAFRSYALQQYFYNCHITRACNNGNAAAAPNCATAPHMQGSAVDFGIVGPGCQGKMKSILNSVGWTHWSGESWHYEYGTKHWAAHPGGEY